MGQDPHGPGGQGKPRTPKAVGLTYTAEPFFLLLNPGADVLPVYHSGQPLAVEGLKDSRGRSPEG